jgi:hypothetical protein
MMGAATEAVFATLELPFLHIAAALAGTAAAAAPPPPAIVSFFRSLGVNHIGRFRLTAAQKSLGLLFDHAAPRPESAGRVDKHGSQLSSVTDKLTINDKVCIRSRILHREGPGRGDHVRARQGRRIEMAVVVRYRETATFPAPSKLK